MRILIATAGVLAPEAVAEIIGRLHGAEGEVLVVTVIEVPRSFLEEIRSDEWHPLTESASTWSSAEDAVIARYVEERGTRLTEPLIAALKARGVEAGVRYLEGEDPAATIVDAADDLGADIIVMGATKQLFAEDHWESVSARVIREGRRPVLIVPGATQAADELP